jgi:hypothetical protein
MVNQAFLKGIIAMRFESNEKLTAYVSENPELKMPNLSAAQRQACPSPGTLHFLLIRHCPGLQACLRCPAH